MKQLFTILILCSALIFPQEMRRVVTESFYVLSDIYFADENTGWASGYAEVIYKTTDGGKTWNLLNRNTAVDAATFYAIQFLDLNTGFVGGGFSSTSSLRKTTDGGDSWTNISFPAAYPIKALNFIDEQNGWVLASNDKQGQIYKTTDAGASWSMLLEHLTGDLEDLKVLPSGKGVCVGGGVGKHDIYYTSDGNTWTKAPAPGYWGGFTYSRLDPHAVWMVDENLLYTCGWGSYIGLQPGIFTKSTDGGATWTYLTQAPENRQYQNSNAIYFKDAENGISFGGGSYEGTIATRTTDGGTNWVPFETGLGFTVQSCHGIGEKIWIAGSNCIAFSADFGNTWEIQAPMIGTTLNDIQIINNTIYAGGYNGVLYKSTDKGINWSSKYTAVGKVCPTINSLHFLNESTGFFAKNNQMVIKTTDGGSSFSMIMKDTSATGTINTSLYFFDENNGYVAGRYASNADIIYKTIDGGVNWTTTKDVVLENLNDISFFDANNGVAVANDRQIAITTDAGNSWVKPDSIKGFPGDLDITAVAYTSANHVIAVGEKCIVISEDGGKVWQYYPSTTEFKDVVFKTEMEGWAVGGRSILYTTDGGFTWIDQNDTLVTEKNTFNAAAFDDLGYLWVAGGSSIFTFSPLVNVNEVLNIPVSFGLSQNFPNPFNPATTIKYSLAVDSKVTIKVFDILGNHISELVNDYKPAGEYEVKFNAEKLSSGIYFYVLNSGSKVLTRKMTLLK